jgi:hypothetical protein
MFNYVYLIDFINEYFIDKSWIHLISPTRTNHDPQQQIKEVEIHNVAI